MPSKSLCAPNLRAHLRIPNAQHMDTRFHAISILTRYFMTVGANMPMPAGVIQPGNKPRMGEDVDRGNAQTGGCSSRRNGQETDLMKKGRRRIVWEAAVGCLALSVKVT